MILQLTLAFLFGSSFQRDAYFSAIVIPNYVALLFTGSVGMVFLPKLINISKSIISTDYTDFIKSVFIYLIIFTSICVVTIIFLSKSIIKLTAPGYLNDQINVVQNLIIITSPIIIFNVLINFISSVFQSKHKYLFPALLQSAPVIGTLIFVFFAKGKYGIESIAVSNVIGLGIVTIILFLKLNSEIDFLNAKIHYSQIKPLVLIALPLFLTSILFRSTTLLERMLASKLPSGSISYLGYSNQLIAAMGGVISAGIATTAFTKLATIYSSNNLKKLQQQFVKSLLIIQLLVAPICFYILFSAEKIIAILFERGAFSSSDTIQVSIAFKMMTGLFFANCLGSVVAKGFYINGKTKIASGIAIVEVVVYFIAAFLLINNWGFKALALAYSFSSILNIITSLFFLKKKFIGIYLPTLLKGTFAIICASSVMYLFLKSLPLNTMLVSSNFIFLLLTGFLALTIYIVVLIIFNKINFFRFKRIIQ